ncbi:amidase family protein [Cupriavidus basilensis]
MARAINHTVWRTRFAETVARHAAISVPPSCGRWSLAAQFSGVEYQQAMFERSRLFLRVQALLQRGDLLAMPTLMRTALPIGQDLFGTIDIDGTSYENLRANWFPWTMPFNMTGHPAISMPCGLGRDGLPIGFQLVGQFRGDAELLRVAALFEAAHGLTGLWPPLP